MDIEQAINYINAIKKFPIYFNDIHETWVDNYEYLEFNLIENNITILENDVVTIDKENKIINLIGIGD